MSETSVKEKCASEAKQYAKEFGEIDFIKTCLSAVNTVLVDKGLVTEDELRQAFLSRAKENRAIAAEEVTEKD